MLSLIIPCFNESEVLELTYQTLVNEAEHWDIPVELLLVDDGSQDDTWPIIEWLAARDDRVRGLRLSRNFGHQAAVGAGLEQARGDAVIVLDADLQDPPQMIAAMLDCWRQGYDVVAARRNRRAGESAFKKVIGYLFYRLLTRLNDVAIPTDTGDFALLDRRVVDVLLACREHSLFWRGLRCYAGFRHTFVSFDRPPRLRGQSKYTLRKLMQLAANGLLSYSAVPLRLGLYLGAFALLGSLLVGAGSLACALLTVSAPSVSALGVGLFFLGSVQLVCLGICGEYLHRIYEEVRNRPRWIVAEQVDRTAATESRPTSRVACSVGGSPIGPIRPIGPMRNAT